MGPDEMRQRLEVGAEAFRGEVAGLDVDGFTERALARTVATEQLALWDVVRTGPWGFPICGDCKAEGIGPNMPWCIKHWTPERDPEGAASARRLGLLPFDGQAGRVVPVSFGGVGGPVVGEAVIRAIGDDAGVAFEMVIEP